MRYLTLLFALSFLGGLTTGKSLLAQERQSEPEWAAKPIQCMEKDKAFATAYERGQKPAFGGLGKSASVNYKDALDVFVFLMVNLEDQTWSLIEVDSNKVSACIIGYGQSVEFDGGTLQTYTAPRIEQ